jgi:hypothetical protein
MSSARQPIANLLMVTFSEDWSNWDVGFLIFFMVVLVLPGAVVSTGAHY